MFRTDTTTKKLRGPFSRRQSSSSASSSSSPPRVLLCISWRRITCILTCLYVACILLVLRSIGSLPSKLDKNNIVGNHGDTSTTPFSKSLQSMNHLDAVTMKKAAGPLASASSSSTVVAGAGAGAAVVAINNAFQDTPRVDDWYKDVIVRMEEKMNNNNNDNNISRGNVVGFQSCRRRVAKSKENADYYYSIEPLAACRTTTAEERTRKFVYFNPYPRPRILCGHTLAANNGTLELDEPACLEPARLFPVIPSLETALELPPTITRFNDPGQQGQVEPFADCDIPCHHGGYLNLLSTRTIDGTPFQLTFSMEGQQYYPMLRIKDAAYRDNVFYSTTSFRSEVPLPYFSYAEYNIQKLPAVDYNTAEKAAVFLARNCGSISQREALVTALHESGHFRIDSLSDCLHNAEPPNGIDLGDKINVMRHYLFYLAFENQRVNDYITEKLWGPYEAGTVPVYFGAPNIKQLAPNHSYIDVDDFPTPADLAIYLNEVANNQTLYESYHAWRQQPLPPHFTAKFNISKTHSTCRTCRWAFARMYGLGWSHENQSITPTLRSTSRNVCLDGNSNRNGGGMIARPFREVWLDAQTNQQVMAGENNHDVAASTACQEVNSKTRTVHFDDGRFQRTVWEQDGVVDIVLEWTNTGAKQQPNARRQFRLLLDTPIEIPAQFSHVREGQVRLQNHHSRFTLLTWPTRVSNITHVAATNGSALVLDLHQLSAHATFPLHLRVIMEDVDLLHKGADKVENYFGQLMIDDFFQPVEAFYRDETSQS